ncbi:MAG: polymer-forming cytoskeletal protein [Pelolinea sp.]|nr:polymer-forming cytoskeletal protein [Pelolinea sp.]
MFRKNPSLSNQDQSANIERVTSVLGAEIIWKGKLTGKGGVRIEGTFEGEIAIQGLVVVGETGKVTCENVRANTVIIAGGLNGGITAKKLEIRKTGRVWGDVVVSAFSTEEGGFLRGQITMQEEVDLGIKQVDNETNDPSEPAQFSPS